MVSAYPARNPSSRTAAKGSPRSQHRHGTTEQHPHGCFLKTDCKGASQGSNMGGVSAVMKGVFPQFDPDPHCNHGHSGPSPTP